MTSRITPKFFTPSPSHPLTLSSFRGRGSVLIIVVAILTIIALMGTAYIATARLDRYAAQSALQTVQTNAQHDQYVNQATELAKQVIANDADQNNPGALPTYTSSVSQFWLADRLPELIPNTGNANTVLGAGSNPMWRYFSGDMGGLLPPERYVSPLLLPTGFSNTYSGLRMLAGSNRVGIAPTSISITYPNDYTVEALRNKTRTFPAVYFVEGGGPATMGNLWSENSNGPTEGPGPILAADADGDGIADSVLIQMGPPVNGITYFMAVRIIDNNSAINVNTAWRRDADFDFIANAATYNHGFFTSNIGLYELLDPSASTVLASRSKSDEEIYSLNQRRLGYPDTWESPFTNAGTYAAIAASASPWEDPDTRTPQGNGNIESQRMDFSFWTTSDALFMQLGRRTPNPGYNYDMATNFNVRHTFRYQAYGADDGASLAYRFVMVQPDTLDPTPLPPNGPSGPDLELRLRHSVIESAINFTQDPTRRFFAFPANQTQLWFWPLNFAAGTTFQYSQVNPAWSSLDVPVGRFRPIRPLLTTYNPTNLVITPKINPTYNWGLTNNTDVLAPGIMPNNELAPAVPPARPHWDTTSLASNDWNAGTTYNLNDIVRDPVTGLTYISVRNSPANVGHDPSAGPGTYTDWNNPANTVYWEPQAPASGNICSSVNVAGFRELWRAFMFVMSAKPAGPMPSGVATPFDAAVSSYTTPATGPDSLEDPYLGNKFPVTAATAQHPARMLRSSVRDPRDYNNAATSAMMYRLSPFQMMEIRSALAAVNTLQLRSGNLNAAANNLVTRSFTIYDVPASPTIPKYEVTVYSSARQPYITEVYANNDPNLYTLPDTTTIQNPAGYVAIELFNPYPTDLDVSGWALASIDRSAGSYETAAGAITLIGAALPSPTIIPAGGYLLLESYSTAGGGESAYRPPSTGLPLTGALPTTDSAGNAHLGKDIPVDQFAAGLGASAWNHEVILLRPRVMGTPVTAANIADAVPVDQFDFTGIVFTGANNAAQTWHYARANSPARWQWVYPGRYAIDPLIAGQVRQQGVDTVTYDPTTLTPAQGNDPWNPSFAGAPFVPGTVAPPTPITLGGDRAGAAANTWASPANAQASYPVTFTIQICNQGMPGPNLGSTPPIYPFGGFARSGDILQVPYIGSYRIRRLTGSGSGIAPDPGVLVNAPAILTELNSVTMDAAFAEDTDTADDTQEQIGRFCPINPYYDWASQLFTYLGVQIPGQDYLPEADPAVYPPGLLAPYTNQPQPVPNGPAGQTVIKANQGNEDLVGFQGKINPNTAPAVVLNMLPLVPDATTGNVDDVTPTFRNSTVARDLVNDRETTGVPFKSLFDLNRVPTFPNGNGGVPPPSTPPQGAVSLAGGANDFAYNYLMMNRISNLITLKSDTFTCYVLVQGWRNAGTAYPSLDWEKRVAFIADRSARKSPTDPTPLKIISVPAD